MRLKRFLTAALALALTASLTAPLPAEAAESSFQDVTDPATAVNAEVRLYDNLFSDADPDAGDKDFLECLNPASLEVLSDAKVEASLASATAPASFQFLRQGYFCVDSKDSTPEHLVFNRSVSLKDSFKVK